MTTIDFNQSNDEFDNLHIPHINILQWDTNIDKKLIKKINSDHNLRPFAIRYFIEDPRAKTPYTHVNVENELSQHIKVNGDINFWFEKNNDDYLNSILVGLYSKNFKDGFRKSFNFINSILSMLSFFYRRPFKIWQIKVTDKNHHAIYSTRTFCPKSENLVLPASSFPLDIPIGSLFAIYREGMNSIDLAYRFISFFKIYEAWYKDKNAKKYFNRNKQSKPKIKITKNLLADTYRDGYHKKFISKGIADNCVYSKLCIIRNYLSHPFLDQNVSASYYNFDQMDVLEEIEAMSNLIERIVTKILDKELELWAKSDEKFKNLLQIYNINRR